MSPRPRVLIYLLRRDLRVADNPVLDAVLARQQQQQQQAGAPITTTTSSSSSSSEPAAAAAAAADADAPFTHVLPVYVVSAEQVEVAGFLRPGAAKSPYPEARSQVAGFWRCGHHRSRFLAESLWDLKTALGEKGSGLEIRIGMLGDVVRDMLAWYNGSEEERGLVAGVWMTADEGVEEKREEREVRRVAEENNVAFKLWADEKFFVDDRDLPFTHIRDLPDVYTTFRKSLEPLRTRPRAVLPTPTALPPLPPPSSIPPQSLPFEAPTSLDAMISSLHAPLDPSHGLENPPKYPPGAKPAHAYSQGGEAAAHAHLNHLLATGVMTHYKETRNGLLGPDFSTKLAAWLALGCLTARQVHAAMLAFEDGGEDVAAEWRMAPGFGEGENEGTGAVRFELLWRDYMRLCTRKFGAKLFDVHGFRGGAGQGQRLQWRYLSGGTGSSSKAGGEHRTPASAEAAVRTRAQVNRFLAGRTGIGLIDASQRELFLTGYTSNRARQNVASFLTAHLNIDWRIGAEWYETQLTDYDVSNNWGNWQYVAGVGNDPRLGRKFNPVKQALEYDDGGRFVKEWVHELRGVDVDGAQSGGRKGEERLMGLFQAWRLSEGEKARLGLRGVEWVERPLVRVPFAVGLKAGGSTQAAEAKKGRGGGRWRGGGGGVRGEGRPRRLGEMEKAARPDGDSAVGRDL